MRSVPHSWEFFQGEHHPEDRDLILFHGSVFGFAFGDTIALYHATRGFFAEAKDLPAAEMIAWGVVMLEAVFLSDETPEKDGTAGLVEESAESVLGHYAPELEAEKKENEHAKPSDASQHAAK